MKYLGTDINSTDSNIAWFEVEGETFGRTDGGTLLDCDGCPVDFPEEKPAVPEYRED